MPRPSPRQVAGTPAGPSVSVALCTYQGARHLSEQLDSLLTQTRPPDEVVACDDASTDGTVELLREFASAAPFAVHVDASRQRLGSTENFARAMARCTGDVVMCCDQDDVWLPAKIEQMLDPLTGPAPAALAFCDAELIDEESRPNGHRLWEAIGFGPVLRARFARGETVEVLCVGNVVTGAASALSARYLDLVLPIPPGWVHDAWMAIVVACVAEVQMVPEPLVRYRLHGGQQIGVPTPMTRRDHLRRRSQLRRRMRKDERTAFAAGARGYRQAAARVRRHPTTFPSRPSTVDHLEAKAAHLEYRADMHLRPARERVRAVAAELAVRRYHGFSNGWPSAVKDLLLPDQAGRRRR